MLPCHDGDDDDDDDDGHNNDDDDDDGNDDDDDDLIALNICSECIALGFDCRQLLHFPITSKICE